MNREPDADLLRELEPAVARGLERHLDASRPWQPHQYVPWSAAEDFDGPLGGRPWHPDQSRLTAPLRDALVLNVLTEDNLPSYYHALAVRLGHDGAWGAWVRRWTAEEDRHSYALRAYLHATRAVDPVALEQARMSQLAQGFSAEWPTVRHALAYVLLQERATRVIHRNVAAACGDPDGERLMGRIAADENLHMLFYRDLCAQVLELEPDAFVQAFADVAADFRMPGHAMPGFTALAAGTFTAGIFDSRHMYHQVALPTVRALGLLECRGLRPSGEQARDRLGRHLEVLERQAIRLQGLRSASAGNSTGARHDDRTEEVFTGAAS